MAQLDVYQNCDEDSNRAIPYLLDIQHDMHRELRTRIVIPLVSTEAQKAPLNALCPSFVVEGRSVFASIPELSAYPVQHLGEKVASLERGRYEVFLALDFLLHGF